MSEAFGDETCASCGKDFPADEVKSYKDKWYCTECFEKVNTCTECGEEFRVIEMKSYKGAMYCEKCYKEKHLAKPRQKKDQAGTEEKPGQGSTAGPQVPATSIADAIAKSLGAMLANPIKIELAPLQLQVTATGPGFQLMAPVSLPMQQSPLPPAAVATAPGPSEARLAAAQAPHATRAAHVLPPSLTTADRPYLEPTLLRIMGARKHKWRPAELATEARSLHPGLDVKEEDVTRALDRLKLPLDGASPEQQVVQLSTRYMRRDFLVEADEMDFLDLLILKVLATAGTNGMAATTIHEAIRLCNLLPASMPTVLNHLRMLKSPGWELVDKAGKGFRDYYVITTKGANLLGEAEDAATGFHDYAGEWKDRFERMGVTGHDGGLTENASILMEPLRSVAVKHAATADKQFILAYMEKTIDPAAARTNARKVEALRALGF